MSYIVLIGLAFLAATKAAIQGLFAKKMKSSADNFMFNALMFTAIVIVFAALFGLSAPSPVTLACAAVFGIASVLFQFAYSNAMKHGSVALTVFINSFHLIFPIALSAVLYGEIPHASQYIGLVFLIYSVYMIVVKKDSGEKSKNITLQWIVSVTACTFCAGCTVSAQKIHQHTAFKSEYSQFIVCAYIIAAVLSYIMFLYFKFAKHEKSGIPIDAKTLGFAALIGAVLGLYNSGMLYYSGIINSVILNPTVNISSVLWSTVYGAVLFKERLTKNQKIGFAAGIISIFLITI